MNILWFSNAMNAKTGYGVATKSVVPYLINNGYPTTVLSYAGISEGETIVDGVRHVVPHWKDTFGNDSVVPYFNMLGCDLVIVHRDIWVNNIQNSKKIPTLAWFPIDHFPISDRTEEQIKNTAWSATMSQWGVRRINKAGYEAHYIPHSFNPNIFNNKSKETREETWNGSIPDDAYVITMVAANRDWPPRKGFIEAFMAVSQLMQKYKDIYLYMHTNYMTTDGGPNLLKLAELCGIDLSRLHFTDPYFNYMALTPEKLASIYRSSDLYLSAAHAEGFGIPIIEAQACGLPVVLADNSSQTELCFKGELVPCELEASFHYTWWKKPIVSEMVKAIENSYLKRDKKDNKVPDQIKKFTDDYVFKNNWIPLLSKIDNELSNYPSKYYN